MSIFFWRKNKGIDIFSSTIADEFYSNVLPELADTYFQDIRMEKSKKDTKRIESEIERTIKKVEDFRKLNSLGVYGKARLHLKFTDRLTELGYSPESAKKINQIIMLKTP